MYAAIGFGEIATLGTANTLTEDIRSKEEEVRQVNEQKAILEDHKPLKKAETPDKNRKSSHDGGIVIDGVDNLLVRLSHCCNPIPGDNIIGYITKGRGVSIHRVECPNVIKAEESGERIISVKWEKVTDNKANYQSDLEIQGYNRSGLLNDILQSLNNTTKQLSSVNGRVDNNKIATMDVSVGVKDIIQLERTMETLKSVVDVYAVKRKIH